MPDGSSPYWASGLPGMGSPFIPTRRSNKFSLKALMAAVATTTAVLSQRRERPGCARGEGRFARAGSSDCSRCYRSVSQGWVSRHCDGHEPGRPGRRRSAGVNSGPKLAENQRFEIAARPHFAVDLLVANLSGTPCPVKAAAAEGGGQRPAFTGHGVPPNLATGDRRLNATQSGNFQTAGFR